MGVKPPEVLFLFNHKNYDTVLSTQYLNFSPNKCGMEVVVPAYN